MDINISQVNESTATIHMVGQFWEHADFVQFREKVNELIEKNMNYIFVDLSRVSFLSSQALGLFISIYAEVNKQDGNFILYKPMGCVKEIIEISGLDLSLKILHTEKEMNAMIEN
jgi:anti-anti-sigma factor